MQDEGPAGSTGGRQVVLQKAHLLWGPATGAWTVYGGVLERYLEAGGPSGPLGLPTSGELDAGVPGARVSAFQTGRVYWSAETGAHEMYGAVLEHYLRRGGPAAFGTPTSGEISREGARVNEFRSARIYWTPQTGATSVFGGIMARYDATGGARTYGLPLGDEQVDALTGAAYSRFAAGDVYWTPSGAHGVFGAVYARWRARGGTAGLGLPLTDEVSTGAPGGRAQAFTRGEVHWSAGTGAWAVLGGIRTAWLATGGATGRLGLPTSDEYAVAGGTRADFQRGWLTWSASTGRVSTQYR